MSYFVMSDLTVGYWFKVKSAQVFLSWKVFTLQLICVLYIYMKSYGRIQTVVSDLTLNYWVKVKSAINDYIINLLRPTNHVSLFGSCDRPI
jgi:hypothetical protein